MCADTAQHRGIDRLAGGRRHGLVVLEQRQHAGAGVVLKHQRLLGGADLRRLEHPIADIGDLFDQVPLRGVGQRQTEQVLQRCEAVEGQTQMVMRHRQDDLQPGVIALGIDPGRQMRDKQGPAGAATQALEVVARHRHQRLAAEAQAHQRRHGVQPAAVAGRTARAGGEVIVGTDLHLGSGVVRHPQATMTRWRFVRRGVGAGTGDARCRGGRIRRGGGGVGRARDVAAAGRGAGRGGVATSGCRAVPLVGGGGRVRWRRTPRLLGGLTEQQAFEFRQADAGLQQGVLQPHQGAQQRGDAPLIGGVELALLGPRDQALDLARLDRLGLGGRHGGRRG